MGGSFSHLTIPAVAGCASWCWNEMRELCASLGTQPVLTAATSCPPARRSWPEHVSDIACCPWPRHPLQGEVTQAALSLEPTGLLCWRRLRSWGPRSQAAACMGGGLALTYRRAPGQPGCQWAGVPGWSRQG